MEVLFLFVKVGGEEKMVRIASSFLAVVLFLSTLFLSGCADHKNAYKDAEDCYRAGDLDGAIKNCIAALYIKPDYKEASLFLKEMLPKAYEMHMNRAKSYTDWDSVIAEYDILLRLSESISSLKGSYPTIDIQEITEKRKYAVQKSAEAHYNKGILLMEKGGHKEAVQEFKKCQHFVPGYKDAELLYTKSRELATTRIAIVPFENMTGKIWLEGTVLTDQATKIASNLAPDLIEFITGNHLAQLMAERGLGSIENIKSNPGKIGKLLGIHAFVLGKIDSLIVDSPSRTDKIYNREAVVSRQEGYSYKVTAECTQYTCKREVTLVAEFQIFTVASGSIVKRDTLKANVVSEVNWAHYEGDERALTYEDKYLCAKREGTTESEKVLVDRAVKQVSNELATGLVNFFKMR